MKGIKHLIRFWVLLLAASLIPGCGPDEAVKKPVETENVTPEKVIPTIKFTLLNSFPHDTTSFTEGFLYHDGKLFESTGATDYLPQTKSLFGTVDLKSGKIDAKAELDRNKYFGEGIVFLNDKVYQLTYKNQICFIYDAKTFKNLGQFGYMSREGWGLTTNGKELIMSDGTNALTFIDPNTYQPTKTIVVSENNVAVDYLNELEYVNGFIYANIWMSHKVVKINPENGEVVAKFDLGQFAEEAKRINKNSLETNGIAYNPATGTFMVTGKMWPKIYEIKFPI